MEMSRRDALIGTLAAAGLAARAGAQTPPPSTPEGRLVLPDPMEAIDLWPGPPPGAPATLPVEPPLPN